MRSVTRAIRPTVVPILVLAVSLGGCGDDEGLTTVEPPPDLTGTWTLQSFTQAGVMVPGATGTLVLDQTATSGSMAEGTYDVQIDVPGQDPIQDMGTFTIDGATGAWAQESSTLPIQSVGTFELQGNTLAVEVTQPAQAANTTVWTR